MSTNRADVKLTVGVERGLVIVSVSGKAHGLPDVTMKGSFTPEGAKTFAQQVNSAAETARLQVVVGIR